VVQKWYKDGSKVSPKWFIKSAKNVLGLGRGGHVVQWWFKSDPKVMQRCFKSDAKVVQKVVQKVVKKGSKSSAKIHPKVMQG